MTTTQQVELKAGSTFSWTYDIPAAYADGYFATGWTMYSQAIDADTGAMVENLEPQWVDEVTTRAVQVVSHGTEDWPRAVLVDVLFLRTSDGLKLSTETVSVKLERRVSVVMP